MEKDYRKDFLMEMYKELCSEIDRHIKVIWQIVGVLLSTFAVYALVEKNALTLDIATSILVLVCGLSCAIVIESNYWYNRNLVIIANIERQFLLSTDGRDIQHYFKKHRENNAYLDMMIIQLLFILILLLIIISYHFFIQVWPNRYLAWHSFDPMRSIPYVILVIILVPLWLFHHKRTNDYNEFRRQSPGIEIQAESVSETSPDPIR